MPSQPGRGATHQLTRLGLVLTHGRTRGAWLGRCALVVAGMLAGAAGGTYYMSQQQAAAVLDQQQLGQRLEQTQLTLRVSESRSLEIERQIETLIQQLRECREELTFFRKARDGKH